MKLFMKKFIAFLKYDVQVKDISIKVLKNQLEEALKEKYDLKLKLEKFEESSNNLTKLIDSAKDKTGLGYDSQMNESEVVHSVFNSRESDVDDSPVNDRFKTGEGFHAVPPPYTGNYMPSRPDLSFVGLDDSVYKTKVSETETSISRDKYLGDNGSVFRPKSDKTIPKFTKINFVKSGENVKSVNKENTHRQVKYPRKSQSPRDNRRNWNGMMTQKLGNGFESIRKACFVCGSLNHLIKDCDFHENQMVEKPELNNKGWEFVPTAVATKSGQVPVNAAKQSSPRACNSINYQDMMRFVAFGGSPKGEKYVVLFTRPECLVLSPDFKLLDESQVLLKVPRHDNMYSFDLMNVVPSGGLTCLFAKATIDESNLWHRRLGHINFKTMNKLVRRNLVKGLPSKLFENDHTCVACQKGKQHKASWSRPDWLFDIDLLTNSMNYEPVTAGNPTNKNAVDDDAGKKTNEEPVNEGERNIKKKIGDSNKRVEKQGYANSTNRVSTVSPSVSATGESFTNANDLSTDPLMPDLEDTADLLNTEPKKVTQALIDPSWIEAMQDELLQIEAIRLFLAYASFMRFIVYQMDVKSEVLYGTIKEEVYVCQPPGFEDPQFSDKVYKVEKALYVLHQSPKAWSSREMMESSLDKTSMWLINISQDKYMAHILKKFDITTVKATSTPIETNKALNKDEKSKDVDVHLYRSMIRSLMYLTTSRSDIMFAVCACARFQVTPKISHLQAVKRIFRYLKGQPKLGLWYPRDSPFDLEVFSNSDYAGASLDRKYTTSGCQFLGKRLISWQCKKQTIVANSTTEAEYVAAANCYGQNPVFHSKTKHSEIRHHFIKDSYEKKLVQVIKTHTDHNVVDLLIKAFDVNKTVYQEWEDRMERATTTASSLEAEQDSGNINRTQFMATLNELSP
ncbi:putative reverse transcriptase, RNA-dependent DNA polymerase [Tanacetum coccineum]